MGRCPRCEVLPHAASIAYFDASFPPHTASYAIDQEVALNRRLKNCGFTGSADTSQTNLIVIGRVRVRDRGGTLAGHNDGTDAAERAIGAARSGMVDPPLVFQ
ncbi:hypothetical protein OBBRIDRAFT_891838 [Obba rivulosa]|uniref:Uncharacterized protein n=1 Tax=Obba rivulosa TaxID=1052685 RepID=A0A8E2ALV3_9APHY|nr:hypothetical protein OBBRIDRAFT_891838 [Obba rivulosa]